MNQAISVIMLIILAGTVLGADWYVRPNGEGSFSGADWSNTWNSVTGIQWSKVNPGDTIWLAGGSYGTLVVGRSGNADSVSGRIFIKRAVASAHGTDTGWASGMDTQVTLAGLQWTALNTGSYVTVDGQVDSGIRLSQDSGGDVLVDIQRGVSYVTLSHLDLAGPCGSTACFQGGDNRNIDTTAWNGASYEPVDHLRVQHSRLHGGCTLVWAMNVDNSIWEYNKFYDNDAIDSGSEYSPNECHPNIMATGGSDNVTFRHNEVYNYAAEGIMYSGGEKDWYIYGNIWRDRIAGTGYARVLEADGIVGPVYFYNNVMANIWIPVLTVDGGSYAPGSKGRNNIYWNNAVDGGGLPDDDYDLCSGSCSGSHSISSGSNPFVNLAGKDYHIISTVGTRYPKDKGANLGSAFNIDIDGNIRGSDGAWDIGAYEYAVASATCEATGTAKCRYVDSASPCSGSGCDGTSWAKAWKGVSSITGLSAGDYVYFSGGTVSKTYSQGEWAPIAGAAGKPITYKVGQDAGHNGIVIFSNSGSGSWWIYGCDPNNNGGPFNYVTIDGNVNGQNRIKVTGFGTGVYADDVTGSTIRYVNITSQIRMYGSRQIELDHLNIYLDNGGDRAILGIGGGGSGLGDSRIHDCTFNLAYQHDVNSQGGNGDDGIANVANVDIYNNRFIGRLEPYTANQHQDGIQSVENSRIFNNYFENMANYQIYGEFFGSGGNLQIYNNIINYADPALTEQPSVGIAIGSSASGVTISNIIIANNLVIGGGRGISLGGGYPNTLVSGSYVVNNIVYNSGTPYELISSNPNGVPQLSGNGITRMNNKAQDGSMVDVSINNAGSPNSNPVNFVSGSDFHLSLSDSGAANQGSSWPSTIFTTDKDGILRPQGIAWDIGPYERSSGQACAHPADTDCSNCVETGELNAYVNKWLIGQVAIASLIDAIKTWKGGCS
jgi:hypothetical protein